MKRTRMILFVLAVLFLLALPGSLVPSRSTARAELFPCDPTPTAFRKCQLAGGVFDFAACRCVLP